MSDKEKCSHCEEYRLREETFRRATAEKEVYIMGLLSEIRVLKEKLEDNNEYN